MYVKILNTPPMSGSLAEHHYSAFGSCTWVQFSPSHDQDWAGVFGNGTMGPYTFATVFNHEKFVMVGAQGITYIVELQTKELSFKPSLELIGALSIPNRDFAIAYDYCHLYALNSSGIIWNSPRVALDGIVLESANETELYGQVWQ